jgi:hypothetical protein
MIKKILLFAGLTMASITTIFAQKYKVVMTTTQGEIEILLYDETPLHTNNFVKLAHEGFYGTRWRPYL